MADVQLEFYNSTLTGEEEDRAEKMGMLLLASDFMGSRRVGKAENLDRISKANIPILLSRTKSGDYLAINPFSEEPLEVSLTQLPSRSSILEEVSDSDNLDNLDLDRLYRLIMDFETKETEILGAFDADEVSMIEQLLQAPKSDRDDFKKISPTRDINSIKEDIKNINDLVYDDESLEKEINDRLDIIEKALEERYNKIETRYDERKKYWKEEIENKNELLQKRLKERDKQFEKDKKELEKEIDRDLEKNLKKFKEGVTKNIRKDEKPIEKSIQRLEKLVSQDASKQMVDQIEQELTKLSEFTQIFAEAVGFAKDQVGVVKEKEDDILSRKQFRLERLKKEAEKDKEQLREDSKQKERERDNELEELKRKRDEKQKTLAKFRDVRKDWVNDIKDAIGDQETPMVKRRFIPSSAGDNPKNVTLLIPSYIFQYKQGNEHYTLTIPPVKMPDSLKKPNRGTFYGDHKTVYYRLVVDESEDLVTNWFSKQAKSIELQNNIQSLPNLLHDTQELRDTFFSSRSLMVDKLKVQSNKFSDASSRLTDADAFS